ncbi:MAG TPA: type I glutamate--ammonia ligase [Longimicrobiaceae bacterium]
MHEQTKDLEDKSPLARTISSETLTPEQALHLLRARGVRYLRLVFTDIFGTVRGVEVTRAQFGKALEGRILFDGSAMDADFRVEESDMLLRPDLHSLRVLPWEREVANVICAVYRPDGGRFEGDPRASLERAVASLAALGYEARVGADLEFFLFRKDAHGNPLLAPHDRGGYYELGPGDQGAVVRREVMDAVEALGLEVRSALHEVAAGQHRIELVPLPALRMADALAGLRATVRMVAERHGLHASFMPKPLPGLNGSGLHLHHSLWKDGINCFFDEEARDELSATLRAYVGGLLHHARAYCAVTNPLVNSYKRLVPGHEAPVNVAWSLHNRSPMIRIPMERGEDTRCEVRIADASANPYLALAVQIATGAQGLREEMDPGEPINKSLWTLTPREKQRLRIKELPRHLGEALDELEHDRVTRAALGEYIYSRFTHAKREEWLDYLAHVHPWEVERYL